MPSAAPVPRSPSVLLLGSAAGLLTTPGCPACRYTSESSETYLTWFALEGHSDPDVLQVLRKSRGMCARHTRRLLAQPGADARLTAVYKYVVAAAVADLGPQRAGCPACAQEAAAADRVLDILLEEFTSATKTEYKLHGGLCLPHLRRAARRTRHHEVRWLLRFMIARLSAPEPDLDLMAGWPDGDADTRARMRAALPPSYPATAPDTCSVCWSSADFERMHLNAVSSGRSAAAPDLLCGPHLRDAADAFGLLAQQAEGQAIRLARALDGQPRLLGIAPGWLSAAARRALADPDCPVCRGSGQAAADELGRVRAWLRRAARPPATVPLCARHATWLHGIDAQAGRLAAGALGDHAARLATELDTAFRMRTWAHRNDSRGPEMNAWRRAAVFLDGSVLGGCLAD